MKTEEIEIIKGNGYPDTLRLIEGFSRLEFTTVATIPIVTPSSVINDGNWKVSPGMYLTLNQVEILLEWLKNTKKKMKKGLVKA